MLIFDVRNANEYQQGHIEGVVNIPLIEVSELSRQGKLGDIFPWEKPFYVHCKSGTRSMMACSILRKFGFTAEISIDGGYDAILKDNTILKLVSS